MPHDQTAYAGTIAGVFKTTDGGAAWFAASTGLAITVHQLAIATSRPSAIYAATDAHGRQGIYRTSNGGKTWLATASRNSEVHAVTVDPDDSRHLYAGSCCFTNYLFVSSDSGHHWGTAFGSCFGRCTYYFGPMAFDPRRSSTVYLTTDTGLWKSTDNGQTWTQSLPFDTGLDIAVDPTNPNVVLAIVESASYQVLRSADRGTTWQDRRIGIASGLSLTSLSIASDGSATYLGTSDGVYVYAS